MPRAGYKPFTAYEEAMGWKNAKRMSRICFAFFVAAYGFKLMIAYNQFSTLQDVQTMNTDFNNRESTKNLDEMLMRVREKEDLRAEAFRRRVDVPAMPR